MIIDERRIASLRTGDEPYPLQPRWGPGLRYTDDPSLIMARLQEMAQQPSLLADAKITPTSTTKAFKAPWAEGPPGHRTVVVLAFLDLVPPLPATRTWLALRHQCAGVACRQLYMVATVLEVREEVAAAFNGIADENDDCGRAFEDPESGAVERYLARLGEVGLACGPASLAHLCESVYPVDATPKALARVTEDGDDLLGLLFHPDPLARPLLVALSENSD